jgi:methionine synthase II (cobalamin-independent)
LVNKALAASYYAEIAGSAINQNGRRSQVITAPHPETQEELIIAACHDAGIKPQDISYVECHGTGTKIGDPIEISALKNTIAKGKLKREYDIISSYGFHLQVDCPDLAMGRYTRFKSLSDSEFLARIDTNIRILNDALSSVDPAGCRVHICWGNYPGTHHCDIDLKSIFNPIAAINARYISLEASNHRHAHEWTIFSELAFPEDTVLMPGVIDTTSNTVEHPDLVAQRIANFVRILGVDRVVGSTDCGFATTASAMSVSGEVAWLKLAALVEGAKRASAYFN